jgi:hypothetical protein
MSSDWDRELARIDKQLASLSDDELAGKPAAGQQPLPSGRAAAAASPAPAAASSWGLYLRLAISVALGLGMLFWPYETRCGAGAAAYLGAVAAVVGSGIWSAVWSWRHRASRVHGLSLLLVLWGLVLGATDVLPRVGYARPAADRPAGWSCS